MPLVSVIMPVHNGEKYLAEAIDSILAQTFTDFELIIVDDGSHDNTANMGRSYAKRIDCVRFFRLERHSGVAAARNHAVAAATGTYVANMDGDDISLPERLQKQVCLLQSEPELGAVSTHAKVINAEMQFMYDRRPPEYHARILLDHYIGNPFVHASLMLRRDLILDAGGYDQSLRYGSDSDLMTRLMGRTRLPTS